MRNFNTGYRTGYKSEEKAMTPNKEADHSQLFLFNVWTVIDKGRLITLRQKTGILFVRKAIAAAPKPSVKTFSYTKKR